MTVTAPVTAGVAGTATGTATETRTAGTGSTVDALARITATPDGRGGTALPLLAATGPLAVRRTVHPDGPASAQATLVGAMAAPLGGDRLRIEVRVLAGARLRVTSAAATLSLPGRVPAPAYYDLDLRVEEGGTLEWLPEPVIAAAGSELRMTTRIRLDGGARLLLREEQILGRSGETPGRITARLMLRHTGRTLLDQRTDLGPGAPAWSGPAVLGNHRALGQLLVVDPALADGAPQAGPLATGSSDRPSARPPAGPLAAASASAEAALLPLAGCPGVLLTALAPDGLLLRRALESLPAGVWPPR